MNLLSLPAIPGLPAPPTRDLRGKLTATILSIYDLPSPAEPNVTMEVGAGYNNEGPGAFPTDKRTTPAQKSSDFRFTGSSVGEQQSAGRDDPRLSDMYGDSLTFHVSSGRDGADELNLKASLPISSMIVGEARDLILTLRENEEDENDDPADDRTASSSSTWSQRRPSQPVLRPTLRLRLILEGPLRPEISTVLAASRAWFGAVDGVAGALSASFGPSLKGLPPMRKVVSSKYVLVPAVPVAVISAALAPAIVGALVVGLPLFLPLFLVAFAAAMGGTVLFGAVAASTPSGRKQVEKMLAPIVTNVVATNLGQRLVYETGSRVSPVDLAGLVLPRDMLGKLFCSLLIDLVGSCSYLIPIAGEAADLAWAPLQMILVASMYDSKFPNAKYFAFAEEILPFTDVIPTASLCWVREYGPELLDFGMKKLEEMSLVPSSSQ
eukprot:CAMPEP_0113299698 /NCGR_PEP_ID=MMETSP0010_2-20120614/1628_1 /TAXON_ID=216773 ORGANISM="Corethron hystrix, Strain 308" /NCGR_SAMPLE_ID=MMETSP0010_2 /ASSEMBLY_ACC=CAM_ASM_000155 /LENGTH=436 /DNA_ID=CAMNT_0000152983 /DNA_START=142 /DNA_END=1453 /DNA_ORIENTATION=+ /assembly_acc=CAM_ASM_000155